MTALTWAAQDNRKQAVDVLLKAGANPNIQNKVRVALILLDKSFTKPSYLGVAEIISSM